MGFQVQDGLDTIEYRLECAISKVCKEDIKVYSSGRTDKGVHAMGQVIHFDTPLNISEYGWKSAINSYLPPDIRVCSVEIKDESFHSRFSAQVKEYRYYIINGEYNVFLKNYRAFYKNLDTSLMKEALKKLVGTHDFKGFASSDIDKRKDTIKTIYSIDMIERGDEIEVIFRGNAFLKYQIRRMMGLIIDIGLKRDKIEKIDLVFEKKDPSISHKKAPAEGLFLYKVEY